MSVQNFFFFFSIHFFFAVNPFLRRRLEELLGIFPRRQRMIRKPSLRVGFERLFSVMRRVGRLSL